MSQSLNERGKPVRLTLEVTFFDPYGSAQRCGQFKFWNADWDDVDLVGLTCCHLEGSDAKVSKERLREFRRRIDVAQV